MLSPKMECTKDVCDGFSKMGPDGYLAGDSKVVDAIEKFVLSLIAYEAAKAAPAASPERVKLAERADGVPELFVDFARSLFLDGETCAKTERRGHRGWITILYEEWPKLLRWMEAEIARRVAEDRRDALCHCQKKLKEARTERDAALAEVERLKSLDEPENDNTPLEHPAYRRGDDHGVSVGKFYREQLRARVSELEARVAEQTAEIERLTRPVESESDLPSPVSDGCICPQCRKVRELFRRERNAREAAEQRADKAEASLAELREAIKALSITRGSCGICGTHPRPHPLTDDDVNMLTFSWKSKQEPAK